MSSEPDPYVAFARHRERPEAVVEEEVETTAHGERRWFGVYRWDAVREALNDEALSSEIYQEVMGLDRRYGEILPATDGAVHRAFRAPIQPTFTRSSVDAWHDWIDAPIEELVANLAPGGGADLRTELCEPIPALVLTRLFAVDDDLAPALRAQALAMDPGAADQARAASDALLEQLRPIIEERRAAPPRDDLVSALAHARLEDRPLTDHEVFSHLRITAIAGTDTVTRGAANLLAGLLTQPDQLDAVRADPALAGVAADEAIRWECPSLSVPRVAREATSIQGAAIPAGAAVRCCLGSANRDPARWSDPDRFDLFRERLPNAGFGLWAHACLGVHLARRVMERTLLTVLQELPQLRLDAAVDPPTMAGEYVRAPTHLRVRWG